MSDPEPARGSGPAVLELGEQIGAAVIYTKGVHDGAELEIKPHAAEWNGQHTAIRRRRGNRDGHEVYAALFFGLQAGSYDVRLRGNTSMSALAIDVVGGEVTEEHLTA